MQHAWCEGFSSFFFGFKVVLRVADGAGEGGTVALDQVNKSRVETLKMRWKEKNKDQHSNFNRKGP